MSDNRVSRIEKLCAMLQELTDNQLDFVERVAKQFTQPYILAERIPSSDIVTDCLLTTFGDALRIHHCFSKEPLSKDRFEYALERSSYLCRLNVELAPKGNPGHDITISGVPISLKTEASAGIRTDRVHISKFMELGKGEWDLPLLRERYLNHMQSYDRIFTLRCLSKRIERWHYQLVEIPKALLLKAQEGLLRIDTKSRQNPQPGYCDVIDANGSIQFQLYFDAGTERKLQVRNLDITYCIVHATWIFSTQSPLDIQSSLKP
ncbi:MAG: restriction endonuclease [Blastochloris sp.]|nr:restriction endonuclease [Blastochloris sp.]